MAEPRATGTPFLRWLAASGWPLRATAQGLTEDPGPLRLGITGRSPVALHEPYGSFGGRRLPRGMAIGEGGRIFLCDPQTGQVLSALAAQCVAGADPFRPLWPPVAAPDPWHFVRPTDVVMTGAGDLAIADPGGGRVLVIAWPSAVIRQELRLPGWHPAALATDRAGWLIVADPERGKLHRFDRDGRRDPDWPHGSVLLSAPEFLAFSAPDRTGNDACGCGCGGSRCGSCWGGEILFVLDQGRLLAIGAEGRLSEAAPDGLVPPALLKDGTRLLWDDPAHPGRGPLVIPALALSAAGTTHDLPVIALPRRAALPRSGHVVFDGFDSGISGFAWDRLSLDLTLPPTSSLVVTTLTSDAPITAARITAQPESAWSVPLSLSPGDAPEILIQSPPGRWLWLRIDFLSDGSSSPEIHRLDLTGPRRSGLRHLPASFHQDPQSRAFLDRFLSYFDTIFAEIRQRHRETGALFDPAAVPEGAWLDWLGSWFDLGFLARWDVATRREMVASAIETARMRGTKRGVQRMLAWHLGLCEPWPMIIEHFRLHPGAPPVARVPLPQSPEPHRMTIVLPRALVPEADEPRLQALVDGWIPAHSIASLRYVETGMILGCQSLLGVDTLLSGDGTRAPGAGRAGIDFGTAPPSPRSLLPLPQSLAQHDRSTPCLTR